jgi:hypothetical protein
MAKLRTVDNEEDPLPLMLQHGGFWRKTTPKPLNGT